MASTFHLISDNPSNVLDLFLPSKIKITKSESTREE